MKTEREVHMATTAQIFANQENSKRSTGPRTPEGKAASSHNATADGFFAADPVLPSEDRNQFNTLFESYNSDFAPTTAHEEFLVSQMAGARWKLDRVERIEVAIFTALDNQCHPATAAARRPVTGASRGPSGLHSQKRQKPGEHLENVTPAIAFRRRSYPTAHQKRAAHI